MNRKSKTGVIKLVFLTILATTSGFGSSHSVNSILGDVSFIEKFKHEPDVSTDEDLRIRTHLEYVELKLRQKDCSDMPVALQQRRVQLLDALHEYWTANVFPRNAEYKDGRTPVFIDKTGRICAVGYLIEQSVGRAVAEEINTKHQYERLSNMNDETVDAWIISSGLSKEECCLIQPQYGYYYEYSGGYVDPALLISTSVLSGANVSLSIINAIQISKEEKKKTAAIVGALTGAGQVLLGVLTLPESQRYSEDERTLSMINIGLGTTTMILSSWNLVSTQEPEESGTSWNFNVIPMQTGDVGIGFFFVHRL